MEERLDDAIYVLRNHAEGQFPREFHGPMGAPVGVPGYPGGSVTSSMSGNTPSGVDSVVSTVSHLEFCLTKRHTVPFVTTLKVLSQTCSWLHIVTNLLRSLSYVKSRRNFS